MIYLLDVNALLSLAYASHDDHSRVAQWLGTLDPHIDRLGACAITELGVVRILPQMPGSGLTVKASRVLLEQVKETSIIFFEFLGDSLGANQLPGWVKQPKQTTDGHLLALAQTHQALLATLDRGIPGAFVIPKQVT